MISTAFYFFSLLNVQKLKFFVIGGLFLLAPSLCKAQKPLFNLTTANGLSSNQINCIAQTADSSIWIGTEYGLNKFDGIQTQHKFAHDGIGSNKIVALCDAPDTTLWIGTDRCICRLKYSTDSVLQTIPIPEDIAGRIEEIKIGAKNTVWIRTNTGLAAYSINGVLQKTLSQATNNRNSLISNNIRSFAIEENGNLWIGTDDAGIDFYNVQQEKFVHYGTELIKQGSNVSSSITDLEIDKNGSLWVADSAKILHKIHLIESSGKQFPPNGKCSIIRSDGNDRIWIFYPNHGLFYYSPQTDSVLRFIEHKNLGTNVSDLLFSKQKNIWIATQQEGVAVYKTIQSTAFHKLHSNSTGTDIQMAANSFGNYIWLQSNNTLTRSAVWFDSHELLSESKNDPLILATKINSSFAGYGGKIWVACADSTLIAITANNNNSSTYKLNSNNRIIAPIFSERPHIVAQDNKLYSLNSENTGGKLVEVASLGFSPKFIIEYNTEYLVIGDMQAVIWDSKKGEATATDLLDNIYPINGACLTSSGGVLFATQKGIFYSAIAHKKLKKPTHIYKKDAVFSLCEGQGSAIIFCTSDRLCYLSRQNAEPKYFDLAGFLPEANFIRPSLFSKTNGTIILNTTDGVYLANETTLKNMPTASDWEVSAIHSNNTINVKLPIKSNSCHIAIDENQFPITLEIGDRSHKYLGKPIHAVLNQKSTNLHKNASISLNEKDLPNSHNILKLYYADNSEHPLQISITRNFSRASLWFGIIASLLLCAIIYFFRKQITSIIAKYIKQDSQEEKIKDLYQTKLGFFTEISHEIRTPLTMILDPVNQILKQESLSSYTKDKLQTVLENGDKILGLINKLLDYRKLETGSDSLITRETDLIAFTQTIIKSFNEIALQRDQQVVVRSGEETLYAWIDRNKLRKIISSIVETTLLLTPENKTISISIEKSYSKVRLKSQGKVVINISSTNNDSQKKTHTAIERFFTYTNKDNPDSAQGLRLVLAKKLTELHKGELLAEKDETGTLSFTLKLPLGKQHLAPHEITKQEAISTTEPDIDLKEQESDKKTILLVEDNESVLAYLDTIFLSKYIVLKADNGREGLEKALKFLPDIIVSDVMMPEMDGTEMCRKLKANHATAHIPILLLTAKTFTEDQVEGLEAGADDYITKPFKSEILDLKVRNVLDAAERMRKQMKTDIISRPTEELIESEEDKLMKRLIEYIDNNLSNMDLSVETMASEMGISRAQLFRKTKAILGHTPNDLLKSMRLKRAEQLLKQGNLRISDISFEVGFANPQYFSQSFTKMFGHTPSVYQKKHKN